MAQATGGQRKKKPLFQGLGYTVGMQAAVTELNLQHWFADIKIVQERIYFLLDAFL